MNILIVVHYFIATTSSSSGSNTRRSAPRGVRAGALLGAAVAGALLATRATMPPLFGSQRSYDTTKHEI